MTFDFLSHEAREERRVRREEARRFPLARSLGSISIKRDNPMTTFESEFADFQEIEAMRARSATAEPIGG